MVVMKKSRFIEDSFTEECKIHYYSKKEVISLSIKKEFRYFRVDTDKDFAITNTIFIVLVTFAILKGIIAAKAQPSITAASDSIIDMPTIIRKLDHFAVRSLLFSLSSDSTLTSNLSFTRFKT